MTRRMFVPLALIVLALLGFARSAQAQTCAPEVEPNDQLAQARALSGCVAGTIAQSSDVDLYRFTIAPAQAGQAFTLVYDGIPGVLSQAQLFGLHGSDQPKSLLTVAAPHGGEARSDLFLLGAGDYLVGILSNGATGPYQVRIESGDKAPPSGDKEPNDRQDQATKLAGAFDLSGSLASDDDRYAWTVSAAGAGQVWSVTAQAALDRNISVLLFDASTTILAWRDRDAVDRATLAGLKLEAGTYFLQLIGDSNAGNAYRFTAVARGAPETGGETEPNDHPAQATRWSMEDAFTGQLNGVGDVDMVRLSIDAGTANVRFDLRLESGSRSTRSVCLSLPDTTALQCRQGLGKISLPDLVFTPGDYLAIITGDADPGEVYTLTRTVTGIRQVGLEDEPNDLYSVASPLDHQNRAQGRFAGQDTDFYRLVVTGTIQLWRIQAIGDGISGVTLVDAIGNHEQAISADSPHRARLTDVLLLPGTHYIALSGEDGSYMVMAIALGPPPQGVEQEPNDTADQANPLPFDTQRRGLLNESSDADYYRFTLAAEEHIRITVTPPDDGQLQVRLWWDVDFAVAAHNDAALGGAPYVLDTFLEPGDYVLRLAASQAGDSPYTLKLEHRDPFEPVTDREPNDGADLASPVPASLDLTGTVSSGTDEDWYRLPTLSADTGLTISAPPTVTASLRDAKGQSLDSAFTRNSGSGTYTGALSASTPQPFTLKVTGDGSYEIRLAFGKGPSAVPPPAPPALKVGLTLDQVQVAAFWPVGQAVSGTLSLENTGAQPLLLSLDARTTQPKIEGRSNPAQVTVPAGGRKDVPVALIVAADLPVDTFPVTWRARAANGSQVTASVDLTAGAETPAQSPRRVWPIPDSMLGGLDVALLSLGAQIVTPDADLAQRQAVLHDGYTALQDAFQIGAGKLPIDLTVKLAGNAAVPVTGILLNPQSAGPVYEKLKDFELWLSSDGQSFARALQGSLSSSLLEQAFPLPQAVPTRYARLRLLTNQVGNRGNVELGEWKVVVPISTSIVTPIDLATPDNGGEIVYVQPQPGVADDAASMLKQDQREARLSLPAGTPAEWILGFQHGRAAEITSVQWTDTPTVGAANRFTEVDVSASLDSPVGPWTLLGHWKLAQGQSTFSLPGPTWVRFLRFTSAAPAKDTQLALPDLLRVIERPAGATYRSIVGEWGHYSREGAYEWLTPPPPAAAAAAQAGNGSPDKAQAVSAGSPVQGTVQIGQNVAWYRIDIPAGKNGVVLRLTGQPTVGVSAVFQDAAGKPVPVTSEALSPSVEVITATVTGGSTAYFRIEEPPHSIIFAWDNSQSMVAYQGRIYDALTTYLAGVTPGREVANLLPLGGSLLLKTWGEDPTVLQEALNNYDRQDTSSNAEAALLQATEALAYREGTKAIVLITDAESDGYDLTAALWQALAVVQPRAFTMAVSSHATVGDVPANPQDLMQNWAAVNSGDYDFLTTTGGLDTAFARATAWLRRPALYGFTAQTAALPPPGPGTLTVLSSVTGQDAAARGALLGNTSVELILDASGSMNEKLGNSTRIAVAKTTIANLVDNILPRGIPLALRAFGNREGKGSCRTDLELPLAPLDPAVVVAKVNSIQPQVQGATPIGASLLKVSDDLKNAAPGPKLVILLTDGEETCKGDPAASVAALRKLGIDIRINIVGYTVTDTKLKGQMAQWATAGGGQFLAALDQKALASGLLQALRVPYQVLDAQGKVVAQGLVDGDPVKLPTGVYSVKILTNPTQVVDTVTVSSGKETVLRVTAGK